MVKDNVEMSLQHEQETIIQHQTILKDNLEEVSSIHPLMFNSEAFLQLDFGRLSVEYRKSGNFTIHTKIPVFQLFNYIFYSDLEIIFSNTYICAVTIDLSIFVYPSDFIIVVFFYG